MRLTRGAVESEWSLRIDAERVRYERGHVDAPDARITQDLAEVVRAVFGPGGLRADGTREVALRGSDTVEAFIRPPWWFRVVQRVLATMAARDGVDLTELAARYGSDKWASTPTRTSTSATSGRCATGR